MRLKQGKSFPHHGPLQPTLKGAFPPAIMPIVDPISTPLNARLGPWLEELRIARCKGLRYSKKAKKKKGGGVKKHTALEKYRLALDKFEALLSALPPDAKAFYLKEKLIPLPKLTKAVRLKLSEEDHRRLSKYA